MHRFKKQSVKRVGVTMSKKKKVNWIEVGIGTALIAFSVGNTPLIPDEPILVPLGAGLIGHAFGYF